MEIQDILSLVKAVADHSLTELKLDDGNIKLTLKREEKPGGGGFRGQPACGACHPAGGGSGGFRGGSSGSFRPGGASVHRFGQGGDFSAGRHLLQRSVSRRHALSQSGDTVKKGQVLGIIEAMKLMNEIESEYDGIVEAILVNNEDVVEFGQPLFRIR